MKKSEKKAAKSMNEDLEKVQDETMGTLSDEALKDVAGGATTNSSTTNPSTSFRTNGCRGCPIYARMGNDTSAPIKR